VGAAASPTGCAGALCSCDSPVLGDVTCSPSDTGIRRLIALSSHPIARPPSVSRGH
jgi:hypothetical protein